MNIFEKLTEIQNELKAPKSQYNSFGKYNYRAAEDILEAAKPICKKYKTVVYVQDDIVNIGNRFYVKSTAILHDCEDVGTIEVSAFAREEEEKKGMDGSQVTGASSSYARKYALGGLFAIDDTKDSDGTNNGDQGAEKKGKKPEKKLPPIKEDDKISPELKAEIMKIAAAKGYKEDVLKKIIARDYGKSSIDELTQREGFSFKSDVKAAPNNA